VWWFEGDNIMVDKSRRQFLYYGLGGALLAVTGCGQMVRSDDLPGVPWPDVVTRPDSIRKFEGVDSVTTGGNIGQWMSRSKWTVEKPIMSRINPMGSINRITIHHEGAGVVEFVDEANTARHLALLRKQHITRGWADIGYHYVIDRAGRVWEARPIVYQGAHVKDHNEHNIGVMLLGNFNAQSPSDAQLRSLRSTVMTLRRRHGVAVDRIFTHRELMPTVCPGRRLQAKVVAMRRAGKFM